MPQNAGSALGRKTPDALGVVGGAKKQKDTAELSRAHFVILALSSFQFESDVSAFCRCELKLAGQGITGIWFLTDQGDRLIRSGQQGTT